MIPKVNRFYYYYYSSDFNNPDNRHSFIQLIAETEAFHTDESLSPERLKKFERNHMLCQLLCQEEWDSRYGVVRYFKTFSDYDQLKRHLTKLNDLLADFGEKEVIEMINRNLEFYFENKDQFQLLRDLPEDHPRWNQILETLESRYFFYYADKGIERIARRIVDNPDDFCVDENGKNLEKDFTGQLETYYANGNLQNRYSFVNGRVSGECMEYNFGGNKRALYFYKNALNKELIKEWYETGRLKYEKSGEDLKYWFDNGQLQMEKTGNSRKRWDRDGNQIEGD